MSVIWKKDFTHKILHNGNNGTKGNSVKMINIGIKESIGNKGTFYSNNYITNN